MSRRPRGGHHHDVVLQPDRGYGHPDGPQRRGGGLVRDGRADGDGVEGSTSGQAHRDGPAGLAEPHRGRLRAAPSPFVEGVLSVDPTAENLGALDASAGQEAAKQIVVDLLTQRPEVNLIYSEASNLTVGTMAGLVPAGPGQVRRRQAADRDRRQRGLRHGRVRAGLRPELEPEGRRWDSRPSRRRKGAST